MKVTTRQSADMAAYHQKAGVSIKTLVEMFPQYGQATIYRHSQRDITAEPPIDRRKKNKGRSPKVSVRDMRSILRAVPKLRKTDGTFTSPRIAVEAGVETKFSNRTLRRILNKSGYGYRQSRKMGLLSHADHELRVNFCNIIRRMKLDQRFWNEHISFYMDAKGFQFKTNPFDQARAPSAREWRKKGEGLHITAKGRKEGAVNANFMVGISYDKGVVLCEQFKGPINGEKMVEMVESSFENAFEKSIAPRDKRFLTDGCPRQNCKKAREAYDNVNAKVFKIPSRSPDLNPIENVFNLVVRELDQQARQRQITKETFEQFSARAKQCIENFSINKINNIIGSMDKRIDMVLECGGKRIKY